MLKLVSNVALLVDADVADVLQIAGARSRPGEIGARQ
jgi:hypothetical protein